VTPDCSLKTVGSLSEGSFWAGVIADVRLRLIGRAFHVAADASWVKVPAGVSSVNADYSSTRYSLMLGYHFGE
jgi:hypothetical protein